MPGTVKYKADMDPAAFLRDANKMLAKMEELNAKGKQVNTTGKKSNKIFTGFVKTLAGFATLGAALGVVSGGLAAIRQESEAGARASQEMVANLKKLLQISPTTEQLNKFKALGKEISIAQGISPGRALGLVFQGHSLGFSEEETRILSRSQRFTEEPEAIFNAVAGFKAAFGLAALGGSPESSVNALLAAAESSKVGVAEIAGLALTPAQAVKRISGTAQETLAAISVASPALASPEIAATSISRFADVASRYPEYRGGGIAGALEVAAKKTPDEIEEQFGMTIRAFKGVKILLQNAGEFAETLRNVEASIAATGTGESRVSNAEDIAARDPRLATDLVKRQQEAALEFARADTLGTEQLQREAITAYIKNEASDKGALNRAGVAAAMGIDNFFEVSPEYMLGEAAQQRLYNEGLQLFGDNRRQARVKEAVREDIFGTGGGQAVLKVLDEIANNTRPGPLVPVNPGEVE